MDEFLRRYPAGSKIDTDGFPPAQPFQCFDQAIAHMRVITGNAGLYITCKSSGYVKDFWNDYGSNGLEKYFDRIPANSKGQYGDIVIWGNAPATPLSHVASLIEDKGTVQKVYGQNQPHPYTTIIDFTSNGILGYLRLKGGSVETIKSMYWRLVGREADPEGLKWHLDEANSKGWDYIYNHMKNSPEGQADWIWRNPDAVRALEQKLADATKTSSQAAKELSEVRANLEGLERNILEVSEQRDILEATVESQKATIAELQKQLDEQRDDNGIKPTPPVDYSWVQHLADWLRSIFK